MWPFPKVNQPIEKPEIKGPGLTLQESKIRALEWYVEKLQKQTEDLIIRVKKLESQK